MVLCRINTLGPVVQLQEEMDHLFGRMFGSLPAELRCGSFVQGDLPALNVSETEGNLRVEVEVPGLNMKDLEVSMHDGDLIIKGEQKTDEEENTVYHRRERSVRRFARTIRLPVEVDEDKVAATLRNGVLSVTLPKTQAEQPRKIEVKG